MPKGPLRTSPPTTRPRTLYWTPLFQLTDARATPAVAYLQRRTIAPPYPDNLYYLPDVWLEQLHRVGEGALVAELHAHGALLGVQVTWLDPFGAKSLHEPVRQTFLFADTRAKAAVFTLQVPKDAVWRSKHTPQRVVCEGVEDALSSYVAGGGATHRGVARRRSAATRRCPSR